MLKTLSYGSNGGKKDVDRQRVEASKPNRWVLALGSLLLLLLSMSQTCCWEARPGNESFGKVAGARRPSRGLIKDLPARAKPFLPTKAVQVVTSWPIARGDTQSLSSADSLRPAHPAEDQANSVTADIRHSDC